MQLSLSVGHACFEALPTCSRNLIRPPLSRAPPCVEGYFQGWGIEDLDPSSGLPAHMTSVKLSVVLNHYLQRFCCDTPCSVVIFFSLTEAPLPDPTQKPETDPKRTQNRPETEPKRSRNGAETEPNGAEMDRNQAFRGGTGGGFVGVGHWEIKGRFRKRVVLANVPSFRFSFRGNIRRNHPFGNHPFVNPQKGHWEIKGRFRKRVVLANVPSFRFSFWGNIRQNHPFGNHPFANYRVGGGGAGGEFVGVGGGGGCKGKRISLL